MSTDSISKMILNPVLGPLLDLHPFWSVLIVSLLVTLIITLIYKWMTDQKEMKRVRDDMKKHQDEIKKHKNDPKKMMEINKKVMEFSLKQMSASLRPMLISFIPVIIIFAWLNANLAYEPIKPGADFSTTISIKQGFVGTAELIIPKEGLVLSGDSNASVDAQQSNKDVSWNLQANSKGSYVLEYKLLPNIQNAQEKNYISEVIVSDKQEYAPIIKIVNDGLVKQIKTNNKSLTVIDLFGWKINWFWSYFIFTIALSALLRKILKVY